MLRSLYLAVVSTARWFFATTRIPKPGIARRANRIMRERYIDDQQGAGRGRSRMEHDLRQDVEALTAAIERLETMAYLDRIGHRPD